MLEAKVTPPSSHKSHLSVATLRESQSSDEDLPICVVQQIYSSP